ncbi:MULTISPECIES: TetR/AcrR family transcriptional regulator [unclassified Streptomyces]|uniref:TetR/AcrR family transcriptional regulator n=1 Tax=unclassified Streptomyces TaxID=2593676 RepID=UPI00136D9DAC|nr:MULTISPECIES: TetR/AcrR family transcriptional regulator [unclassified Streptomyces]NEA01832.1 TetR/AcrR family transcriptional regulator [Streptomyces sp. SID10116]MYY80923.1 TetR family transcriptional regulator [Streptomyces sp. SID335]MYZ15485.1 TetR family transcriptional regulator [Streptomyces sp. SID337]NDZ90428.1 TetR/AcrR family transcriptional regulator [Streptomyces sp. SID10115]NEB43592.1 TetR/AcrR family transcriptional regulator [Streptomyces sp. SID339]
MARPREFDEDRVVTAAMETFWRHGYEATSTRDLCDSTGLGPSSLYNTFGGKRQLYLRALRRYHDTATEEQVAILRGDGSAKERLRAMMAHAVDADLGDADAKGAAGTRGCFAINAAVEAAGYDPEVREAVRRSFDRVEDELCAVVEAGRAAGEIRATGDARVVARRVQSTYYGLRVLSRVQDDREVLLATVDGALADL